MQRMFGQSDNAPVAVNRRFFDYFISIFACDKMPHNNSKSSRTQSLKYSLFPFISISVFSPLFLCCIIIIMIIIPFECSRPLFWLNRRRPSARARNNNDRSVICWHFISWQYEIYGIHWLLRSIYFNLLKHFRITRAHARAHTHTRTCRMRPNRSCSEYWRAAGPALVAFHSPDCAARSSQLSS